MKAQGVSRGIALPFHDLGTKMGGRWWAPRPGRFTPGKDPYKRMCGPQSRSGRVRIIPPPTGFDPRTVQPGASSYIDWDIPVIIFIFICMAKYIYIYLIFWYIRPNDWWFTQSKHVAAIAVTVIEFEYRRIDVNIIISCCPNCFGYKLPSSVDTLQRITKSTRLIYNPS